MKPGRIKNREFLNSYHSKPCAVCGRKSDPAHIKSRGAGGDDTQEGVLALCRIHHSLSHAYGWAKFCDLFPKVKKILYYKGWYFDEHSKLKFDESKIGTVLKVPLNLKIKSSN